MVKIDKNSKMGDVENLHVQKNAVQNQAIKGEQPTAADIQRLAQDLMKSHGQKFANLFGTSLFGSKVFQEDEVKRRQTELKQKAPIKRILTTDPSGLRDFIRDCLHPMYRQDQIIDALAEYMIGHYEMLYDIELPKNA